MKHQYLSLALQPNVIVLFVKQRNGALRGGGGGAVGGLGGGWSRQRYRMATVLIPAMRGEQVPPLPTPRQSTFLDTVTI